MSVALFKKGVWVTTTTRTRTTTRLQGLEEADALLWVDVGEGVREWEVSAALWRHAKGVLTFSMGFGRGAFFAECVSVCVLVNYAAAPATRPTPPLCRLAGVPRRLYSMLQTPGLVSVARAALVFVPAALSSLLLIAFF